MGSLGIKRDASLLPLTNCFRRNTNLTSVNARAILKGEVRSWAEKQEAERTAWLAPGITSVDN
jgi:osmotically-inducible protein OsmY